MPPKTETIWVDGRFVPWDEARIPATARGSLPFTQAFRRMSAIIVN